MVFIDFLLSLDNLSILPSSRKMPILRFFADKPLDGNIGDALKQAGFRAELRGDRTPPISHYYLDEPGGFYAEFLVPLKGGQTKRDGSSVPLTISAGGIVAQKLRYLDLLLLNPWSVDVGPYLENSLGSALGVLIPNPATFLAQKLLIFKYREGNKRAQDALYIHDTIDLFAENLEELRSIWRALVQTHSIFATINNRLITLISDQYSEITDIHRQAANIPQDRNLSVEELRFVCESGLKDIFSIE